MKKYAGLERRLGTYVYCNYTEETCNKLYEYATKLGITNPLNPEKYHSTILYSRAHLAKLNGVIEDSPGWQFKPLDFQFLNSQGGTADERSLVLHIKAPELESLHIALRAAGGTHDYKDYITHLTLSYKCPKTLDLKNLPKFEYSLIVNKVIGENLDLKWDGN